jgi:hypothetical protein
VTQPTLFEQDMNYQTKFKSGDTILREQEYVTILGVRQNEDGAEYNIKGTWKDAALIDRNCELADL